jgi:sortase (surface protein transpeptidase)
VTNWQRQRIAFVVAATVIGLFVSLFRVPESSSPGPQVAAVAAPGVVPPTPTTVHVSDEQPGLTDPAMPAAEPNADLPPPTHATPAPAALSDTAAVVGSGEPPESHDSADPGPLVPRGIRIPAIGVDTTMVELGLKQDRTLEVPRDWEVTGWYAGRSVPGEPGPSVVVGHIDSTTGPAVFYHLRDLKRGDVIEIPRSDGLIARFHVTETMLVTKNNFPTEQVYGPVDDAALRLVTCGGRFDDEAGSYQSNLIVFAEHVGNNPPERPQGTV